MDEKMKVSGRPRKKNEQEVKAEGKKKKFFSLFNSMLKFFTIL